MPALLDTHTTPAPGIDSRDDTVMFSSAVLGPIAVRAADRVTFPTGLYGFPDAREFALVPAGRDAFCWLQSVTEPSLAFLLTDPFAAFPDYAPDVPDADIAHFGGDLVSAPGRMAVLAVVTLGGPGNASANLRAPIVIDTQARCARQIVLPDEPRGVAEPLSLA